MLGLGALGLTGWGGEEFSKEFDEEFDEELMFEFGRLGKSLIAWTEDLEAVLKGILVGVAPAPVPPPPKR